MQRNMKKKYESPCVKTVELKYKHQILIGSPYTEEDPEPFPIGEGFPDD